MVLSFESTRLKVFEVLGGMDSLERENLLARIPEILRPSVVENLPPYFHGIDSKEGSEVWLERMLSESRLFLVKSTEGVLIGFLFAFVESEGDAHIGYLLTEEYWGQGLASELIRGFIEHVSNTETWVRLIGGVDQANIASANLLKKLGFIEQSGRDNGVVFYEYALALRQSHI